MPDETALTMTMTDLLGKDGPSLSATSDMPVITKQTETAAPAPAKKGADSAEDETVKDEPASDETPAWMKREITIERNKRRNAEQQATQAAARLDEALKALQIRTPETKKSDPPDPRPTREQHDDPDAYDEALIEWSSRRAASAAVESETQKRVQAEQAREQETIRTGWETRRAQAIIDMPDYAEIAESPDVQISVAMAHSIITAPDGPKLAYHLGKHPEDAARIAKLPPALAVFEMGLLSAHLQTKMAPEVSKAPAPVKPLGSRSAALRKSPNEESMEEYAARRNRELRAKPN